MKQVICIKWGTRYGADYVNRLYAMCARNITPPFRFICFTENPEGLREEVERLPLPELGCETPKALGKFRKLALWNADLFGLSGPALFIDLDTVIIGNIDGYFEIGADDDVFLARNWVKPLQKLGQTTIFRFPIGGHGYLLEEFQKDPQGHADRHRFEQHFVTKNVRGGVKFWPKGWTAHFRMHCLGPWPLRYARAPKPPSGAKVIAFPGKPDPEDAALGRWDPSMPPGLAPLAHISAAWRERAKKGGAWKRIKRYIRPAPWIAEHWRE